MVCSLPRVRRYVRRFFRVLSTLGIIGICLVAPRNVSPVLADPIWSWPLAGPRHVSRGFNPPAQNWLVGHRGVDLPASQGDSVFSAGSGTVTFASVLAGRGVVVVTHGLLRTTYEPVAASVAVGQTVRSGQMIGTLQPGVSHCSVNHTVTCLHWGLLRGRVYMNPLSLVQVRLLPLYSAQ